MLDGLGCGINMKFAVKEKNDDAEFCVLICSCEKDDYTEKNGRCLRKVEKFSFGK